MPRAVTTPRNSAESQDHPTLRVRRTVLNSENAYTLSKTLLDILACPACKAEIEYDEAAQKLVCTGECQRRYPIRDGIPVMLIDEAELPNEL